MLDSGNVIEKIYFLGAYPQQKATMINSNTGNYSFQEWHNVCKHIRISNIAHEINYTTITV